jgi:hypothetical protein
MPSPHDKPQEHPPRDFSAIRAMMERPEPGLASEVAALREEIAALRAELKPVSSLILTGQQVAAEFQCLNRERA